MAQKIVQIAAHFGGEEDPDTLYALTDEGRIYVGEWVKGKFSWQDVPLPPVPEED